MQRPRWQEELEARCLAVAAGPLDADRTPAELFGDFDSWTVEAAGVQLWFNPLERTWYHLDRLHDDWVALDAKAGEIVFEETAEGPAIHRLPEDHEPHRRASFAAWEERVTTLIAEAQARDG